MKPRPPEPNSIHLACTCSMHDFPHYHVGYIDVRAWPGRTEDSDSHDKRRPAFPRAPMRRGWMQFAVEVQR